MPPTSTARRSPSTIRSPAPRSNRARRAPRPVRRRPDRAGPDPPPHRARTRRQTQMSAPRYAAVVLPVPVSRPYIYEVPAALADRVVPGARVVVPLRRRSVVGIVTALDVAAPPAGVGIRPLAAAPDAEPALSPALLEL